MYGPKNEDIFVVQGLMETDLHKVVCLEVALVL